MERLEEIGAQTPDPKRFGAVFAEWPRGVPDIRNCTLEADWYWRGEARFMPVADDLPDAVAQLVEFPELGSSKGHLAPTFYDLAEVCRSILEVGVYKGVTATALLSGIAPPLYVGVDIVTQPEAERRLASHIVRQQAHLLTMPIQAATFPEGCFDLIFLDVVHDSSRLLPALQHVLPWLAPQGVIAVDDVGDNGSIYTGESLRAHREALARGRPVTELPPLVGSNAGYHASGMNGHLARLEEFLTEHGQLFEQYHVPLGGGTVFLWDRSPT